jgi:hypothetical protein
VCLHCQQNEESNNSTTFGTKRWKKPENNKYWTLLPQLLDVNALMSFMK